jgi:hypothetical protein
VCVCVNGCMYVSQVYAIIDWGGCVCECVCGCMYVFQCLQDWLRRQYICVCNVYLYVLQLLVRLGLYTHVCMYGSYLACTHA